MDSVRNLLVVETTTLRDTLEVIDAGGLGIALIVDHSGKLVRTVTDGDIRRLLLRDVSLGEKLDRLGRRTPWTLPEDASPRACLELMNAHRIDKVPLLDKAGAPVGIVSRNELDEQVLLSTPHMGREELDYVKEAFETNWIAPLGPNVDAFEQELARKVGIGHAAAVSSGTAALHLALRLTNVGPSDIVFCSSLTFAASANPIVYQGAEPVFIDSEKDSWNMCPRALERAFEYFFKEGKRPKAVIVVNLYGQSADLDPLLEICDHYGVPIVEDAAESLGANYKGRQSGTLGLLGIYSFNGNKIITTSGGGMLVSEDEDLIARARFLATQAREPVAHYEHREIGYNYRMSNILAGVGRGQLKVLDQRVAQRRSIFDRYKRELGEIEGLRWMPEPAWSFSTHWLSVCTLEGGEEARDHLIHALSERLIEARPVWKPMHLQPVFENTQFFTATNRDVSEELFRSGVCLPSGSSMEQADVDRTIAAIRTALESAR